MIGTLDSWTVTRRIFTWAASLILALAIFGMTAQAVLIDPLDQASASTHASMPSGCKSCDTPSATGIHCGALCAPAIALPNATSAARKHLDLSYAALPLAELTGLNAEPDYSPPK